METEVESIIEPKKNLPVKKGVIRSIWGFIKEMFKSLTTPQFWSNAVIQMGVAAVNAFSGQLKKYMKKIEDPEVVNIGAAPGTPQGAGKAFSNSNSYVPAPTYQPNGYQNNTTPFPGFEGG